MRICVKIAGRWIRAKHFLNGEEFDRPVVTDNIHAFCEWFEGALEKARYTQNVEKVKK